MKPNLDPTKINRFRELINSTRIFYKSEIYSQNWNMICAFMDRIDSAIEVLNKKDLIGDTFVKGIDGEIKLTTFLVYSALIVDAVNKLFVKLDIKNPLKSDLKIFNQLGDGTGTDDKFFKHIRALSFAHTIDTDHKSPYVSKGETQYSPYILNGSIVDKDNVIIKVYSTVKEKDDKPIRIPKNRLIQYIESRYNLLDCLMDYLEKEIENHKTILKSVVITISSDCIETLNNLKSIAQKNFDDSLVEHIDDVIYSLNYKSDLPSNQKAVDLMNNHIKGTINSFVESYQHMDGSSDDHPFFSVFEYHYDNQELQYIIGKLRCWLSGDGYEEYALFLLEEFKTLIADKYVVIDNSMGHKEIGLLISAALFMNSKNTI